MGRCHIPAIVDFLGENALDTGNLDRWGRVLSRADCPIAADLRLTHANISLQAQRFGLTTADTALCCFDSNG